MRGLKTRLIAYFILTLLLSACGDDSSSGDSIQHYIQTTKKKYPIKPAEVPKLEKIATKSYTASKLRNPFERPKAKRAKKYPDAILQNYALNTLQLVGTLAAPNDAEAWAFLRTPDGKIYKITKGSRVGTNYALVTQIDHNQVKFIEEQESDGEMKQQEFILPLQKTKQ